MEVVHGWRERLKKVGVCRYIVAANKEKLPSCLCAFFHRALTRNRGTGGRREGEEREGERREDGERRERRERRGRRKGRGLEALEVRGRCRSCACHMSTSLLMNCWQT